jgi:hypothetical protein
MKLSSASHPSFNLFFSISSFFNINQKRACLPTKWKKQKLPCFAGSGKKIILFSPFPLSHIYIWRLGRGEGAGEEVSPHSFEEKDEVSFIIFNQEIVVPSEITSLNQNAMEPIKLINPNVKRYPALEKPCIVNTNFFLF